MRLSSEVIGVEKVTLKQDSILLRTTLFQDLFYIAYIEQLIPLLVHGCHFAFRNAMMLPINLVMYISSFVKHHYLRYVYKQKYVKMIQLRCKICHHSVEHFQSV